MRPRSNRVAVVGVLALLCALPASCSGTRSRTRSLQPAANAPRPDLSQFLPANFRVKAVQETSLDGSSVAQVIVTAVGTSTSSSGLIPADLLILAWDGFAR